MAAVGGVSAHQERKEGRGLLWVGAALFLAFSLTPLAALVAAALPSQPWSRLSDPGVQLALRMSLETSALSTLLCVLLGLPVAYLLARFRFPGRAALDTLVDLPMTLPPTVAGLALLLTFGRMGWVGKPLEAAGVQVAFTPTALVLAQTFMAAPFFIRAARAGFAGVPVGLEHAALTLGHGRWSVFRTVTVPLALPSLLAGVILCWGRAMSEFGATLLFAGSLPGVRQTLPLAINDAFEAGDLPLASALAVVSLGLAFGALLGARVLARQG